MLRFGVDVSQSGAPGPLLEQEMIPDARWANISLNNYMSEDVWKKYVTQQRRLLIS